MKLRILYMLILILIQRFQLKSTRKLGTALPGTWGGNLGLEKYEDSSGLAMILKNSVSQSIFQKWNVDGTFSADLSILAHELPSYFPIKYLSSLKKFIFCYLTDNHRVDCTILDYNGSVSNTFTLCTACTSAGQDRSICIGAYSSGNIALFHYEGYPEGVLTFYHLDINGNIFSRLTYNTSGVLQNFVCHCDIFPVHEAFIYAYNVNNRYYAIIVNKQGGILTPEFPIHDSGNSQCKVNVQTLSENVFVICWKEDLSTIRQILCKTYQIDFTGAVHTPTVVAGPYNIAETPACDLYNFKTVKVNSSEFMIAYLSGDGKVMARKFRSDGTSIGTAILDDVICSSVMCSDVQIAVMRNYIYYSYSAYNTQLQTTDKVYYGKIPYVPLCTNYSLTLSSLQAHPLDFGPYIQFWDSSLKIQITSLPSNGTIHLLTDITKDNVSTYSVYSLTKLGFTGGSSPTSSLTFRGIHYISSTTLVEGTECTLTAIIQCFSSCKTCSAFGDSNTNNCLSCIDGYYTRSDLQGQCISTTPQFFYFNSYQLMYKPCYSLCETCSGDGTATIHNCISCKTGFYSYIGIDNDLKCVLQCPTGRITVGQKCELCSYLGGDYSYQEDVPNSCILKTNSSVLTGYYYDFSSNVFRRCYVTCATCTGSGQENQHNCLTCMPGLYLRSNTNCLPTKNCLNEGRSYIVNGIAICVCQVGYIGEFCEQQDLLEHALSNLGNNTELVSSSLSYLKSQYFETNGNLTSISTEVAEKVQDFVKKETSMAVSGNISVYPEMLYAFDIALNLTLSKANEANANLTALSEEINELKHSLNSYIDLLVANSTLPLTISTPLISVQISDTTAESLRNITLEAYKNGLSIVNFTNSSEQKLRDYYNIGAEGPLIIKKVDYSPILDILSKGGRSNDIYFDFFSANGTQKLEYTVPLENETIYIKVPLKSAISNSTMDLYQQMIDQGVDIFDPNSTAFTSRCFTLTKPENGADLTINKRIGLYYQNQTVLCDQSCEYKGIDTEGYAICKCKAQAITPNENFFASIEPMLIDTFTNVNVGVILCFFEAFKYPDIFYNIGFYISTILIILSFASGGMLYYFAFEYQFIQSSLETIIRNDAQFFKENSNAQISHSNNAQPPPPQPIGANNSTSINKNEPENPEVNSNIVSLNAAKTVVPNDDQISTQRKPRRLPPIRSKTGPNSQRDLLAELNNEKQLLQDTSTHGKCLTNHTFTKKDLETFTPFVSAIKDKRSFCTLLFDLLIDENSLFWLVFKKSIIEPMWYRNMFFMLSLNVNFALNAFVFTDDYIDTRSSYDKETRDSFAYAIVNEFAKSIVSLVFTMICINFIAIAASPSKKIVSELNAALISRDKVQIMLASAKYNSQMKVRYWIFCVVSQVINLFCWYYVTVFCGIYTESSLGWLYGAFIGVIIDICGISLCIPIVRTIVRMLVRVHPDFRYFLFFEYLLWIRNAIAF